MQFRFLEPGSKQDMEKGLLLRWEVLGKPLGMSPEMFDYQEDGSGVHLVAFDKKKMVGCICFFPEKEGTGGVFQMVVSEEYEGNGFSRKFLNFLEKSLVVRGVQTVYLHAMRDTETFYERLGYKQEGKTFQKMGIDHTLMCKHLKRK